MTGMQNMQSVFEFKSLESKEKFPQKEKVDFQDNFQKLLDKSLRDKNLNALRKNNDSDNNVNSPSKQINEYETNEVYGNKDVKEGIESKTEYKNKPLIVKIDGKQLNIEDLSVDETELLQKLSEELGISKEELAKVLEVLDIDLSSLKQFENTDLAVFEIKDSLKSYLESQTIDVNKVDDFKTKDKSQNGECTVGSENEKVKPEDLNKMVSTKEVLKDTKILEGQEKTIEVQKVESKGEDAEVHNPKSENDSIKKDIEFMNSKMGFKNVKVVNASGTTGDNENLDLEGGETNAQSPEESSKSKNTNVKEQLPQFLNDLKIINQKINTKQSSLSLDDQVIDQTQKLNTQFDKTNVVKTNLTQVLSQKENVFNQIIENAKFVLTDTQSEMHMDLKPESLGKLSIKIATENGMIAAKITAESEHVKAIIESNLNQLKDSLQKQGLNIQNLSVSVGQDSKDNSSNYMNNKPKNKKTSINGINTVNVSEVYVDKQSVINPYVKSSSSVDFVA